MTRRRNDGQEDGFQRWVRNNPDLDSQRHGLSICDSDLWIHKYKVHHNHVGCRRVNHIMLVEYKRFGAEKRFAQSDTLGIIDQLLRNNRKGTPKAMDNKPRIAKCLSGRKDTVAVKAWGVHFLQMSGDCPATSDTIHWDRKPIDIWMLGKLLRFELNPDTLKPMEDRRHH